MCAGRIIRCVGITKQTPAVNPVLEDHSVLDWQNTVPVCVWRVVVKGNFPKLILAVQGEMGYTSNWKNVFISFLLFFSCAWLFWWNFIGFIQEMARFPAVMS
jgi:hypothetical protein